MFLKEHRKVEQLTNDFESKLAKQQMQIEALTAGLQKVSAQLEASKPVQEALHNLGYKSRKLQTHIAVMGSRFVVRADEKLTAFLELEAAIRRTATF
jgi:hypothetical protein